MLYICPECGHWIYSLGIAEAFAQAAGAEYTQRCAGCKIQMQVYAQEERIKIIPKRARQDPPQTPTTRTRSGAPQVLNYDREKNQRRRKH